LREGLDGENQLVAYAITVIPIELAVPLMLLRFVSTKAALRSGIFWVAISRICFSVTLPFASLLGVFDPLLMPAAFLSNLTIQKS